tara:strand:+ start:768 stop:1148 length:381 start_codon:yes stop_codon:yes gene_type:complete
MKEITIYTSKTCGYCKKLKEFFNSKDIKFIEKNNEDYQSDWIKIQRLTGLSTWPTTVQGDNYYIPGRDYNNPEQLLSLLNNDYTENFSVELRSEQAMKTLIYSINQGFGRLITEINKLKDEHKSTD